ncbi:hypothetical protein [Polaribacter sp. KT25b]|uniref:hypothetical protein n=1 Tax=Polaribacter sp. KT25b TaxID=1855336 RepID=UPI000AD35E61|nr:hypothetical protein [Polaribacter sp. KT25b]
MLFETERLKVRELIFDDIHVFHKMQTNPKVMQFADGEIKNFDKNVEELKELIKRYSIKNNDFWIYAVV